MITMRTETLKMAHTPELVTVLTFDSVDDAYAGAKRHMDILEGFADRGSFVHLTDGITELDLLVSEGWTDQLDAAVRVAEHAVSLVERETTEWRPVPVLDVTGQDVDVALFLDGEPECMIDYPLQETVAAGRVITLCASIARSAAVDTDAIIRQGQTAVALAIALERCGYALEIYADWSNSNASETKPEMSVRTLVKGANDELDAERIMFALAHPAFHRAITFTAAHELPEDVQAAHRIGTSYAASANPVPNLPEGTIYTTCVRSGTNVPDADVKLREYLRELGILTD